MAKSRFSYFYKRSMIFQVFIFTLSISPILSSQDFAYGGPRKFVRSYYSLYSLAEFEKLIFKIVRENSNALILQEPAIAGNLANYLADYTESSGQPALNGNDHAKTIAGHPLLSGRMIFRYVLHLKPWLKDLSDVHTQDYGLREISHEIDTTIGWPLENDLNDVFEAILRLHHVHDLNVEEIVNGTAFGIGTIIKSNLNAVHCWEIGKYGLFDEFYALSIEWFEYAKHLVDNKNDTTMTMDDLDRSWLDAMIQHDYKWDLEHPTHPMFFQHKLITKPEASQRVKRRTYLGKILGNQRGTYFNHISYWGLCGGNNNQIDEEKRHLYSWYETKSHPYWYINPLKITRLAWYPDVVQIFDVLSNSTISKIIDEATPHLTKSAVVAGPNQPNIYSKHRTSTTAWVDEFGNPALAHIPKRIELITGLVVAKPNSSEMLQIASYVFGARYEVHTDNLGKDMDDLSTIIGDRIATFMIYLTDVEKGGHTVFTQGGISVPPLKGSAVFWYNLKKNGDPDDMSYHGGCPVFMGNKWIANKWIRANHQFRARTCSLNPNE